MKIDAIYTLYLKSFCDKNLAIRKVFAFCDSEEVKAVMLEKLEDGKNEKEMGSDGPAGVAHSD